MYCKIISVFPYLVMSKCDWSPRGWSSREREVHWQTAVRRAVLKWESRESNIRATWHSAPATWIRLTQAGLFWWVLLASACFCLIITHLPTFIPVTLPLIWQLRRCQELDIREQGTAGSPCSLLFSKDWCTVWQYRAEEVKEIMNILGSS